MQWWRKSVNHIVVTLQLAFYLCLSIIHIKTETEYRFKFANFCSAFFLVQRLCISMLRWMRKYLLLNKLRQYLMFHLILSFLAWEVVQGTFSFTVTIDELFEETHLIYRLASIPSINGYQLSQSHKFAANAVTHRSSGGCWGNKCCAQTFPLHSSRKRQYIPWTRADR